MKKRFVICDCDERYRKMMQTYLLRRLEGFEILAFGSVEQAAEYSKKHTFSILLISEHLYKKDMQEIQALQIYILTEKEDVAADYPCVAKYQSMERIISNIMMNYTQEEGSSIRICSKRTSVHAFYSPVRKQEQTKAAFSLGQALVKQEKKVLYLNLQPFSGYKDLLQERETDITDFLYFCSKQDNTLAYRLEGLKKTLCGVDYLAPAVDFMDLLQIKECEWLSMLHALINMGEYDEIILDLSEICQGLYRILEESDDIYTICGENEEEKYSIKQYEKVLKEKEFLDILEKTSWIKSMERFNTIQFGEYMKGLIKENGNRQI